MVLCAGPAYESDNGYIFVYSPHLTMDPNMSPPPYLIQDFSQFVNVIVLFENDNFGNAITVTSGHSDGP
jgi:hypothetical protein